MNLATVCFHLVAGHALTVDVGRWYVLFKDFLECTRPWIAEGIAEIELQRSQ